MWKLLNYLAVSYRKRNINTSTVSDAFVWSLVAFTVYIQLQTEQAVENISSMSFLCYSRMFIVEIHVNYTVIYSILLGRNNVTSEDNMSLINDKFFSGVA